jgi:hypothetical protein
MQAVDAHAARLSKEVEVVGTGRHCRDHGGQAQP